MDPSLITPVFGAVACAIVVALAGAWRFERRRYERSEAARAQSEHALRTATLPAANDDCDVNRQRELAHLARVSMVGELSSALTHEMNQPLTAILSNAQAAQRMLDADDVNRSEVQALLSDIVSEDKRVGVVIERLRSMLTRDETRACVVDIAELVREVLALAHSSFVASKVSVAAHLSPAVPPVLADRVQIQQVLLNLILNATDAMVANDVCRPRQLTLVTTLANDGSVLVTVTDTGPGISAAASSKLFDALLTTKVGGVGFGLSITKSIVDAHGGRIWAVNNPGSGATFCFTLPPATQKRRSEGTSAAHGLAAVFLLVLGIANVASAQSGWGFLKDSPAGKFTDEDIALFEDALQSVLGSKEAAPFRRWANPKSGNSGELRVLRIFNSEQGRYCKRVRMENQARSKRASSQYTLCQDVDGRWLVDPGAKPAKRDSQRGTP